MTSEQRVLRAELLTVCEKLKAQYDYLTFATALDYPDRQVMDLVYHLQSLDRKAMLVLKVEVPRANPEVHSLAIIWPAAEWHEREIFDLFGVQFIGHPDLRRILLPPDWPGHPLRKDYTRVGVVKRPETIK